MQELLALLLVKISSGWDTSKVTNMSYMFTSADGFNQDIGNWNVSSVTDFDSMFKSNDNFNQDLSGWCVTGVSTPTNFDNNGTDPIWGTCPAPSVT